MKRRIPLIFVLGAILLVPALTWALPSPDSLPGVVRESDPSKTTRTQVGGELIVPATGAELTTQLLASGRLYEFDVSGDWQYSNNPAHRADMAFSTADGWTTQSKSPDRSLMIDGRKQSETSVGYRTNHNYLAVSFTGKGAPVQLKIYDNDYSGNTGSLRVTVWAVSKVTWTFTSVAPLPEQLAIGGGSVPPSPIPGVTVSPTSVGGSSGTTIARLRGYRTTFSPSNQPGWCLELTLASQTTQLGCVADPAQRGPEFDQPIGSGAIPQVTVCASPPCSFGGVNPTPLPIGGGGIQRGSSLVLTLSWTGDDSKLWQYGSLNETALTRSSHGWAPFDPTRDSAWFVSNASNLGATLEACIRTPAPDNSCSHKQSLTAPGLGQFFEAMFHTQVVGI